MSKLVAKEELDVQTSDYLYALGGGMAPSITQMSDAAISMTKYIHANSASDHLG
jgi:hypothetical protein